MKELDKKIMNKVDKVLSKAVKLFKNKAIMTNDGFIVEKDINLENESFLGMYMMKLDDDIVDYIHQIIEIDKFEVIEFEPSEFKKDFTSFKVLSNTNLKSYYVILQMIDADRSTFDSTMSIDDSRWVNLSDSLDYNEVFVKNMAKSLKPTNKCTMDVIVSKSLFPNVTKTIYNDVKYVTESYNDYLDSLNIKFHSDGCTILLRYYYLLNEVVDNRLG